MASTTASTASECSSRQVLWSGLSEASSVSSCCRSRRILAADDQVLGHIVTLGAPVGAEMVPMLMRMYFDETLVPAHQLQQRVEVRIAIRRVGQHQRAVREFREHSIECFHRGPSIGERGERLPDFLHASPVENLLSGPVGCEPLQKVVTLDVAVVVGPGHVWWIHVHEIHGWQGILEDIAAAGVRIRTVVEYRVVIGGNILSKVFLDAETKIAPSIVVATCVSSDREHAAWLPLRARTDQGSKGQRPLRFAVQKVEIAPDPIEKPKIASREEDAVECRLDEGAPI